MSDATNKELEARIILARRVFEAARELCTCGGGGPDDPHTCNVCKFYHRIDGYGIEEAGEEAGLEMLRRGQ